MRKETPVEPIQFKPPTQVPDLSAPIPSDDERSKMDEVFQRRGFFAISDVTLHEQLGLIFQIFQAVIPIRCEFLYHSATFEYVGISPMFEVVEEGSPIPWYDFVVKKEEDQEEGTISIMAIRKDKKDLIDQVDGAIAGGIELVEPETEEPSE